MRVAFGTKRVLFILTAIFFCGCSVMQPADPRPAAPPPAREAAAREAATGKAVPGKQADFLPGSSPCDASTSDASISEASSNKLSDTNTTGNVPQEMPEGPLTLDAAVSVALANNPGIAADKWDAAAAGAQKDLAAAERMPSLSLEGGYTRTLDRQRVIAARGEREPGAFTRDLATGELVLSVPLFTGGRLANEAQAAQFYHEKARRRLGRNRGELVHDVTVVFYEILAQRHVIESLNISVRSLDTHVETIEKLVTAQKATRVDKMRTEVRLAELRQELVKEKQNLVIRQQLLANLLGLPDKAGLLSPEGNLESKKSPSLPDTGEATAKALQNRQDYLAAKAALNARARSVDAARAGGWPLVSIEGAYGGRWAAGSTTGPGDDYGDVGRIGVLVDMPLFRGGRIDARIREETAGLEAAQQRLLALKHQVRLEIETAIANVHAAQEQIAAIEKAIGSARESLRIEMEKHAAGRGTIVDVLDAQRALHQSETTYYRAMAELHASIARLELAMGES